MLKLVEFKPARCETRTDHDRVDNAVRLCVVLNDFIEQDGNILVLCGGRGTTLKLALDVSALKPRICCLYE